MPYSTEQYLKMIKRFNEFGLPDQINTAFDNPGVIRVKFHVELAGVSDEQLAEIQATDWFKFKDNAS